MQQFRGTDEVAEEYYRNLIRTHASQLAIQVQCRLENLEYMKRAVSDEGAMQTTLSDTVLQTFNHTEDYQVMQGLLQSKT